MDQDKLINVFYSNNSDGLIVIQNKEINRFFYPMVFINHTGFYLFFDDGSLFNEETKKEILEKVYQLQIFFGTNRLNFFTYSISPEGETTFLNPYSDEVQLIEDLPAHIKDFLNSGSYTIDDNKLAYYQSKANQILDEGVRIKEAEDGLTYIRKGKKWVVASDEDPDQMFLYSLAGIFGAYKFKQGKKAAGVGYLLTCGFFGFGWLFDMLSILLGVAKDNDGYYLLPVSNPKVKWIIFAVCVPLSIIALKLYMVFLTSGITAISSIIAPIIGSFAS